MRDVIEIKTCSKCGKTKTLSDFTRMKRAKDGYRSSCKQCDKDVKEEYMRNNPVEYRAKAMGRFILQRLKYCHLEGYEKKLKCYKDNNVKCLLGNTQNEIAKVLIENFYDDIKRLIDEGKTPSVDRIDSTKDYELGNIRIIDAVENGILGFKSANEKRKKKVVAVYPDGRRLEFDSLKDAERHVGLYCSNIKRLINVNGISQKEKIKFYWAGDA